MVIVPAECIKMTSQNLHASGRDLFATCDNFTTDNFEHRIDISAFYVVP